MALDSQHARRFGVSGLWHGASWTFLVWGLLHGLFLLLEKPLKPLANTLSTFILVTLAWVFFRAPDFTSALQILKGLFIAQSDGPKWMDFWTPLCALGLFLLLDFSYRKQRFDMLLNRLPLVGRWSLYFVLLFLLFAFSGTQKFTFILSLIHISEPTRLGMISYAVFCLKKKFF